MTPKRPPDAAHQRGLFRFRIIADLLARPPAPGELALRLRELAGQTFAHPLTQTDVKVSVRTLERCHAAARHPLHKLPQVEPVEILSSMLKSTCLLMLAPKSNVPIMPPRNVTPHIQDRFRAFSKARPKKIGVPSWQLQKHRDQLFSQGSITRWC